MESKSASSYPGESCFTCPAHFLPTAECRSVLAQDSLLFIFLPLPPIQRFLSLFVCWKCNISLLLFLRCIFINIILWYRQLSLYGLRPAKTRQKKSPKNHLLSSVKTFLSRSVKSFHKDKKTFHTMLYMLIVISAVLFFCVALNVAHLKNQST